MRRAYRGETSFVNWLAGFEVLPKTVNRDRCLARAMVFASTLVNTLGAENIVELKEQLKERCVAERLTYDADIIGAAIDAATRQRRLV